MTFQAKFFHELTTTELYEILKSRAEIFVVEQNCVYQDLDDRDYQSLHVFCTEDGKVTAYLRAFWKEDETVAEDIRALRKENENVAEDLRAFRKENENVAEDLRAFRKADETVQIGRVLTLQHGTGLGSDLLKAGIREVRERFEPKRIYIEAQCYAVGFYEREGFRICAEEFLEDGIPHVGMMKAL